MMQELAPKHAQIHATLDLFPGLTALDLSGKLMQRVHQQYPSPNSLPVFLIIIACMSFVGLWHACSAMVVFVGLIASE